MLLAGAMLAAGCLTMACALVARGSVASPWAGQSMITSPGHSSHAPAGSRPGAGTVLAGAAQPSDTPSAPTPTALPSTPTTLPTTPTAAPTTPSATPTTPSSATPSPTSTGSGTNLFGGNLIWLWVILGALVLLGIILLATRSPGRSPDSEPRVATPPPPPMPGSGWYSRVGEAYSEGAALDHAVRAVARQDAFADPALSSDLQRRVYHLTETLYGLRDTAPTETRRAQVVNALLTLEAVTDLINARRTPGGASSPQGMGVNSRLAALESALNDLRLPEQPIR